MTEYTMTAYVRDLYEERTARPEEFDAWLNATIADALEEAAVDLIVDDPEGYVHDEFLRGIDHGADASMAWLRNRAQQIREKGQV